MTDVSLAVRSFNGGELSPRLAGRADLGGEGGGAYLASAKQMLNLIPLVQGPFTHRSGFRFVKAVKDASKETRLIPFTVSTIAAYVIEAGDLYFRFYTEESRLESAGPVELVTTYAAADVPALQWAQSADTLYIVHPNYPPRKLVRVTPTSFAITNVDFLDGPYLDENIDKAKTFQASAATGAITITAAGAGNTPFLAGRDEGRHIRIRGSGGADKIGWAQITSVVSSTVVNATVRGGNMQTAAQYSWRLGAWYVGNYPRTVTFHEQRLCFAGAPNTIQRIDLSVTGDYERFSPLGAPEDTPEAYCKDDVNDDNAIACTIGSNELNAIFWMRVHHDLLCGTSQSLFTIKASSQGEALTPTNVNPKEEDMTGAADVQAARLANAVLFVGRGGRTLQSAGISIDEDGGTVATDVTELADHIAESGFRQIQAARDPIPLIYAITEDGGFATLTFKPSHRVYAWARHPVGGSVLGQNRALVRSITVIPSRAQDQLWAINERRINGATQKYVEFLEEPFRLMEPDTAIEDAFFLDAGLSYDTPKTITAATQANPVVITSAAHGFTNGDLVRITKVVGMEELNGRVFKVAGAALNTFQLHTPAGANVNGTGYGAYQTGGEARELASSFSGLSHLEGQTVGILADGARVPDAVVSGGMITLAAPASHVHVGLARRALYESLIFETADPTGSSSGKPRNFARILFRVLDTLGMKMGAAADKLVPVLFRKAGDPMDAGPPLFTGDRIESFPGGWTRAPSVVVVQDDPLPLTMLMLGFPAGETGQR